MKLSACNQQILSITLDSIVEIAIQIHLRKCFRDSILLSSSSVLGDSCLWIEEAIHTPMTIKSRVTIFEPKRQPETATDVHFLLLRLICITSN